jgi:hypothetical protein
MAALDTSDYPYRVFILKNMKEFWHWDEWLKENNAVWQYSYGCIWFKDAEIAMLFRLKFGL